MGDEILSEDDLVKMFHGRLSNRTVRERLKATGAGIKLGRWWFMKRTSLPLFLEGDTCSNSQSGTARRTSTRDLPWDRGRKKPWH